MKSIKEEKRVVETSGDDVVTSGDLIAKETNVISYQLTAIS